jgi:mono/diheme cytochrome c family protein
MRRTGTVRLVTALAGLAVGALTAAAQQATPPAAKPAEPPPRTFDYWLPDWMVKELWGPGQMPKGMMVRLLRHNTFTQFGVPKDYQGAASTVDKSAATIAAGRALYRKECATCHGADGLGSGEPGKALTPSPALLAYMVRRPIAVDEYLLWAISDGGKPFDSEMPAYKDKLARDDIWRIVTYMRAGFPE